LYVDGTSDDYNVPEKLMELHGNQMMRRSANFSALHSSLRQYPYTYIDQIIEKEGLLMFFRLIIHHQSEGEEVFSSRSYISPGNSKLDST
jgi:hypothetical protein